jgi:transketolase
MTRPQVLADVYGKALAALAAEDPRIVALDADVSRRMGTFGGIGAAFPHRHFNLGIAEQNMIGVAAGLATTGKIPFTGTYAVFLTGRAWDQVRQALSYTKLNVKLVGLHSGISVGEDGATHQATEDIALMRALPGVTVLAPCDAEETAQAVKLARDTAGPVYIRLFRPPAAPLVPEGYRLQLGKAPVMRPGSDVTLAACGRMVALALEAAETLAADGVSARVLNMVSVKPLDREAIVAAGRETGGVVSIEDHTISGGLGSAIAEVLAEAGAGKLRRIGVQDCFAESGDCDALYELYGLSADHIVAAARELVAGKQ